MSGMWAGGREARNHLNSMEEPLVVPFDLGCEEEHTGKEQSVQLNIDVFQIQVSIATGATSDSICGINGNVQSSTWGLDMLNLARAMLKQSSAIQCSMDPGNSEQSWGLFPHVPWLRH